MHSHKFRSLKAVHRPQLAHALVGIRASLDKLWQSRYSGKLHSKLRIDAHATNSDKHEKEGQKTLVSIGTHVPCRTTDGGQCTLGRQPRTCTQYHVSRPVHRSPVLM